MIIRELTQYQINAIRGMFLFNIINRVGRVDETGDLIIEYISLWDEKGQLQTKNIPAYPATTKQKEG